MSKFDATLPIFVGPNPARENSVADNLRKVVRDLDAGSGVSYTDLEAEFIRVHTPRSAKAVDSSYVKAYVRDAVAKFGQLSQEAASDYSVVTAQPRKAASATPKNSEVPASVLTFIRDRGEVASVEEINDSKITVETLAEELGRKTKTIVSAVETLEAEGLVRSEVVDQSVYVFLTEAGYAKLDVAPAEEAAPSFENSAQEAATELDDTAEIQPEEVSSEEDASEDVSSEEDASEEVA